MQEPKRTIHHDSAHFGWDNSLPPVATVAPGDVVELEVRDASGGQLGPDSQASALADLDFARVNPVTGPLLIDGAAPGDALVVEILDLEPSGWGWTGLIPGFGLLTDDFPAPWLLHSRHNADRVELAPGIELPTRPFPGTIGVAPAEPGSHSVVPPRRVGGNLDYRDLTRGSRVLLPVEVAGALFSVGDTHAAQGHGEVCGTAVESPMTIRLRFDLVKGAAPRFPLFDLPPTAADDRRGAAGFVVTSGVGPHLLTAARDAVRGLIDYVSAAHGLSPELAYALASVAADLGIGEIVNVPNFVVTATMPHSIFG